MKDVKIMNRDSLADAIISSDAEFPLTVTGSSMAPLMKDGHTVVLLTKEFIPAKGRILLFKRTDGSLILHRVRKIGKDYLVMNGDAQGWCEVIKPEQAIAAVSYIKIMGRNVKYNAPLLRIWDSLWYLTFPIRRHVCLHSKQ